MTIIQASGTQFSKDVIAAHKIGGMHTGEDMVTVRPGDLSIIATAGVFHDLGNLIQIVSTAINIVARTPEMPAIHAGPMLKRAKIGLDHARALVRQNIGLIRDRAHFSEPSDVAACLFDVATLVEAMDVPGLALVMDIKPDLPKVRCDELGLRRTVLNLVFNARDAIANNGVVEIGARSIKNGPFGTAIEIRVADNGVGMSSAMMALAFNPFFTTKTGEPAGIGLSMVERFVLDAGGYVSIDSKLGFGTTVTIKLPTVARAVDAEMPGHALSSQAESVL